MKKNLLFVILAVVLSGYSCYGQNNPEEKKTDSLYCTMTLGRPVVLSKTDSLLGFYVVRIDSVTFKLDLEKTKALELGVPEKDYDKLTLMIDTVNHVLLKDRLAKEIESESGGQIKTVF